MQHVAAIPPCRLFAAADAQRHSCGSQGRQVRVSRRGLPEVALLGGLTVLSVLRPRSSATNSEGFWMVGPTIRLLPAQPWPPASDHLKPFETYLRPDQRLWYDMIVLQFSSMFFHMLSDLKLSQLTTQGPSPKAKWGCTTVVHSYTVIPYHCSPKQFL